MNEFLETKNNIHLNKAKDMWKKHVDNKKLKLLQKLSSNIIDFLVELELVMITKESQPIFKIYDQEFLIDSEYGYDNNNKKWFVLTHQNPDIFKEIKNNCNSYHINYRQPMEIIDYFDIKMQREMIKIFYDVFSEFDFSSYSKSIQEEKRSEKFEQFKGKYDQTKITIKREKIKRNGELFEDVYLVLEDGKTLLLGDPLNL